MHIAASMIDSCTIVTILLIMRVLVLLLLRDFLVFIVVRFDVNKSLLFILRGLLDNCKEVSCWRERLSRVLACCLLAVWGHLDVELTD